MNNSEKTIEPRLSNNICDIAADLGLSLSEILPYGYQKAKIRLPLKNMQEKCGKLVLVTAITPTPAGEGKTTVSIGLADALHRRRQKTVLALREPSLGPVFGMKGGATGGGKSSVFPSNDINFHFTGDFHAITSANNLIAAVIDNHIFHGNQLQINPELVFWQRCLDMNDRALRHLTTHTLGKNGYSAETGFNITAASEIMAVFALAKSLADLKERIGNIVVAENMNGEPVYVKDLHVQGAATALLAEAFQPNLVQTLEGTPTLIHAGPFANIAHGCNSLVATKTALSFADFVVTEAGFGADLGAEKFLDIKCRIGKIFPAAAVLVVTVRALKMHGGLGVDSLQKENLSALQDGIPNMVRHIRNLSDNFNLPVVVAVNRFPYDTESEIQLVKKTCAEMNVPCSLVDSFTQGGAGAVELADQVIAISKNRESADKVQPKFLYSTEQSIKQKIEIISKKIYHAETIEFSAEAEEDMARISRLGFGNLPVCIAKTQYSFSCDPKLLGAPEHFTLTVRSLHLDAGAGFIVALTGAIMTMPGLPMVPAAEAIDFNEETGNIEGIQ